MGEIEKFPPFFLVISNKFRTFATRNKTKGDMKKRKPRLNTCEGCMTPYRYVTVKITSVKEIGKERNLTLYEVLYTYAEDDYYHDVYGDKVFTNKVYASSMPYKVGNVCRWPMSIDID